VAAFRFQQPEDLGVFVCDKVWSRRMPILFVCCDSEGDWQFLCGGDHSDDAEDSGSIVCLKHVVDLDESLNEVSELCPLGEARRESSSAPWQFHDGMEDIVRNNVAEHGCHVMQVSADDEGAGFAYSIGLTKNYGQSEVICFGLRQELMHWMINEIRDRMAQGERLNDGDQLSGLIEGYGCILKRMERTNYREYLGYARWFYEGDAFDALQIVWPDKQNRFPWDAGYAAPQDQQPATWQSRSSVATTG
jgi:hypothetical protein